MDRFFFPQEVLYLQHHLGGLKSVSVVCLVHIK